PLCSLLPSVFPYTATAPTSPFTLSLHDALPIFIVPGSTFKYGSNFWIVTFKPRFFNKRPSDAAVIPLPSDDTTPPVTKIYLVTRSEEHTSELQSRFDLVCRLLLEKKKHN